MIIIVTWKTKLTKLIVVRKITHESYIKTLKHLKEYSLAGKIQRNTEKKRTCGTSRYKVKVNNKYIKNRAVRKANQ